MQPCMAMGFTEKAKRSFNIADISGVIGPDPVFE